MAAVVNKVTTNSTSSTTADPTLSINLGSNTTGRLIVAFLGISDDTTSALYASGLDCASVAMTEETGARQTSNDGGLFGNASFNVQMFWLEEATSTGNTNFDVTVSSHTSVSLVVYEITGQDDVDPIGAINKSGGSGTDRTFTLTTANANSLVLTSAFGIATPAAPATGITEDADFSPVSVFVEFAGSRATTTATGYTVGCTFSDFGGAAFGSANAVEIKSAPASDDNLTANSISAASSVGTPAIGQEHALTASGVSAASSVGTPNLAERVDLSASSIGASSSVGSPTLDVFSALAAESISVASTVGTPVIAQMHALTASSIEAATNVGNPTLTSAYELIALSVSVGSSVGVPAIGQAHALAAKSVSSASAVGTPTLADFKELVANSIVAASGVGTPTLGQEHALTAQSIAADALVGNPAIGQEHQLSAPGIAALSSVGVPTAGLVGVWEAIAAGSEGWAIQAPGSEAWAVVTPGSEIWTPEE